MKTSHRPDGEFADALSLTLAWQLWTTLLSTTGCKCHRELENPLPRCWKIADVLLSDHDCTTANALVNFTTVGTCHTDTQTYHRPHGKVADALASTHASTTVAHSPVNYSGYVPQRPETFPSPQWETHVMLAVFAGRWCLCRGWHSVDRELPDLLQHSSQCARSSSKVPIAPVWDVHCFCAFVLAGRRCVHQQWHGDLVIVHHHRQHSFICACSSSKSPIAQMGDSHFAR